MAQKKAHTGSNEKGSKRGPSSRKGRTARQDLPKSDEAAQGRATFGGAKRQGNKQKKVKTANIAQSPTKTSVKNWKRKNKRRLPARKNKRYNLGKHSRGKASRFKPGKHLSPGQKGIAEIFNRYKLPKSFPEKVIQAANAIPRIPNAKALLAEDPFRRDRRDMCCITVDPADAKDFDDAVYAEKRADGTYFLSVNIADVSYYVQPGSSLDKEALRRTCSVYLTNQVIPMLPFALSDDVCSLVPGKDRLAMTVEMELSEEAEVLSVDVFPSIIHSRGRFSYETIEAFLEHPSDLHLLSDGLIEGFNEEKESERSGARNKSISGECREVLGAQARRGEVGADAGDPGDEGMQYGDEGCLLKTLGRSVLACAEIAQKRHARRAALGALEFESQELKFVFNKEGVPTKIEKRLSTPATRMVEEAMLLANECVAKLLASRDLKTAYRVHQAPKQESLEEAVVLLREFGLLEAGDAERIIAADPHAIEAVLERAKKTPYSFLVSQLLLRAQKKAVYLPENEGHYALQASAYLHFTSPIRRYPDILVHRTVKALLSNTMRSKHYQLQVSNLDTMCNACSEGEKRAVEAERASNDVKMAEFYLSRIGNIEQGIIVGVEDFGCFVELIKSGAQGLLPVRCLSRGRAADDWFVYDEKHMALRSEETRITYEIGQKIEVRVASVNVVRGHVNLDLPPLRENKRI